MLFGLLFGLAIKSTSSLYKKLAAAVLKGSYLRTGLTRCNAGIVSRLNRK